MTKAKKVYCVEIEYDGFNREYDNQIVKAAGREELGSGFGGVRDISFDFFQEKAAHKAVARIRRQCRQMHTKVSLRIVCRECRGALKYDKDIGYCNCEDSSVWKR